MTRFEDFFVSLLIMIPIAVLYAVIETWRERREFKKWLREGRWKFEKFKY